MAHNYNYSKYNSLLRYNNDAPWKLPTTASYEAGTTFPEEESGWGNYTHDDENNTYRFFFKSGAITLPTNKTIYGSILDVNTEVQKAVITNLTINSVTKFASDNTTYYIKGTIISSSIVGTADQYPLDGRHTDGYWYVRGSIINSAPSTPSSITVPELKGGQTAYISWGSSSDPDGDTVYYYLQRSANGESYKALKSKTTSRNYTDTILKDWNTVRYRVRASDGSLYSSYRTSPTVTVIQFQSLGMCVDGVVRTSVMGWVCIGGVAKEITDISACIGGIIKAAQ